MYKTETKNQFIELRARGLSLDAISTQLSVPKTTLGRWHHESLEQIQRLRALQWHLLEEEIGQRLEDILGRIAQRIRKWENKLDGQLTVYQKPGDSIRVIRESRREYLQLRALLLAPLQPVRRNAPCLPSVESEKRDKTGQNSDVLETAPLPPNDLQQSEPSMSHSASSPEPESETLDAQCTKTRAVASPLPRGEGQGEGQTAAMPADETSPQTGGDLGQAECEASSPPNPCVENGGALSHH